MVKAIAFFGATGGCGLAALTRSLNAGHSCTALARNPEKLQSLLTTRGVTPETISQHLTIITGSITDETAVTETLKGREIIIFSVGGVPKLLPNPLRPTLDQPTICHSGIKTVLSALEGLKSSSPSSYSSPLLIAVSTTGTSSKRDIPLAMIPLYHWLLPVPHADKRNMEEAIEATTTGPDGVLKGWVIVMPALLTDGPEKGEEKVRAGWEGKGKEEVGGRWGSVEDVAVGYIISREDVGAWIYKEAVERGEMGWAGKKVRLAY